MAKSRFGTKRICPITGKKFYDLNKNPVISPYTGEVVPVVPIAPVAPPRWRSGAGRAAPVPTAKAAPEPDEPIVDDADDEDSTIIADEEEGDQDVTDIIGDVSGDEET